MQKKSKNSTDTRSAESAKNGEQSTSNPFLAEMQAVYVPKRKKTGSVWPILLLLALLLGGLFWWYNASKKAPKAPIAAPVTQPAPPQITENTATQPAPSPVSAPEPTENPTATNEKTPYRTLATQLYNPGSMDYLLQDMYSSTLDSHLKDGLEAFKKGKYQTAAGILKHTDKSNPDYLNAWQIRAHALFLSGRFAEAATAFKECLEICQENKTKEAIEWNLLLSYLAVWPTHKQKFDLLKLKILVDEGHSQHAQVKALLASMEKS